MLSYFNISIYNEQCVSFLSAKRRSLSVGVFAFLLLHFSFLDFCDDNQQYNACALECEELSPFVTAATRLLRSLCWSASTCNREQENLKDMWPDVHLAPVLL